MAAHKKHAQVHHAGAVEALVHRPSKRQAIQPKAPAQKTVLVTIRKEGDKYVAHPKRLSVPRRTANIVFVLENAPANAQLLKMEIKEPKPPVHRAKTGQSRRANGTNGSSPGNPFSFPVKSKRVMLLTDDNGVANHQGRRFVYDMYVMEGNVKFKVDPVIDNDPPPPGTSGGG